MIESAPDLKRGYIVNDSGQGNTWTTAIQSVLVETCGNKEKEKTRYLSQECRRENLPFSSGYLGGRELIFIQDTCFEFITYSCDGRFYQIPVADSFFTGIDEDLDGVDLGDFLILDVVSNDSWLSSVHCDRKEIVKLDFDCLLEGMINKTIHINDLFMRVSWDGEDAGYQLYCPCPYINFSNPEQEKKKYLQPISGHVLVPLVNGVISRGYIACAINSNGETLTELVTNKYNDLIGVLLSINFAPELKPILEKLQPLLSLTSSSMNLVQKVQGKIELFVYK